MSSRRARRHLQHRVTIVWVRDPRNRQTNTLKSTGRPGLERPRRDDCCAVGPVSSAAGQTPPGAVLIEQPKPHGRTEARERLAIELRRPDVAVA
jgi:hypothetical protein